MDWLIYCTKNILIFSAKSCPDVPIFRPALYFYTAISKIAGMTTAVVLRLLSGHSSRLCRPSASSQGLNFISKLWFSCNAYMEMDQSINMEPLQGQGPGQCVFTGQTPWVTEVNSSISRQSHIGERVTWGGWHREREWRVFVETSEWCSFWVLLQRGSCSPKCL